MKKTASKTSIAGHARFDRPARVWRPIVSLLAAASVSLLAGCAKRDSITVGAVPDDYRTNHPIVIAEKDEVLDLPVAAGDRGMTRIAARLARRLPRRLRQERRAGADHHRARPAPPTMLAAADAAHDFAHFLRARGVPESRIMMASYQAPSVDVSAPVRVSYTAMRAQTNKCGRWPEDLLNNCREQALRRISAAPIRTTLPHRSPIRPICSGRASRRRSTPRIAESSSTTTAGPPVPAGLGSRLLTLAGPRGVRAMSNLAYDADHDDSDDARTATLLRCRRCGRCRASRSRRSARPKASPIRSSAPATTAAWRRPISRSIWAALRRRSSSTRSAPTPNLIILESRREPRELLESLGQLAEYCDPSTKVVVIGHYNDVWLYRELIRSGISEYVVAPISMADIVSVIAGIFVDPEAEPIGRSIAFIGAKGGVGSSTIAHNVAWAMSTLFKSEVIVADLDLPSAPPTSISTRIRRKASPRRSSRPSASTRSISTGCSRNARSTCRCWPHPRRSTASMISIRTPSRRSSTRRSAARRCSCSTFRMSGTAGPRTR